MPARGLDLSNARSRDLLDAVPDALVCVDRDGRIVFVSAQAERLFGYPRGELTGCSVAVLVPDGAEMMDPWRYAGGSVTARRKDGSGFPADVRLSALETRRGVVAMAAVRDLTEVHAERERATPEPEEYQSRRLESLGQLAGNVAHDFNNLLGAITNYAPFVAEEVNAAATGATERNWVAVSRDVSQIQRGTERAAALTHQLLAFARREVIRPQVLNLNEIVVGIHQLLRRSVGDQVELVIELEADLGLIKVDPGQVEQVLVNLAVNAREAMPNGGTLRIETANVHVVDDVPSAHLQPFAIARYVRLRCIDTGVGMSEETRVRAFEPFFTTRPKGEGTGLGLASVYGIVNQAGGHVQLESEAGRGTTFTAMFPVTQGEPTEPEEARPPTVAARGGATVLLVEDEPLMREVTHRMLTRNGYEVIAATDGPEAIGMTVNDGARIDLLVTDVVMPQMLGTELARRMKELHPGIGVLFMSGYARDVLGTEGGIPPGVMLLEKPFSEDALLAGVREVLDARG